MSYIENNLVPGETVLYKTRLHWIVLIWPLLTAVLLACLGIAAIIERNAAQINDASYASSYPSKLAALGALLIVGAAITFAVGLARKNATEVAVSNKRVLIKKGYVARTSIEVLLSKIESIGINESVAGRLLGYGTVVIRGTGGTFETFDRIAHPNEFRRQVQQQIGTPEVNQQQNRQINS
jgi:uncharacterized integral membrane protein